MPEMRSALGRLFIHLHGKLPTFRGKQALTRSMQKLLGGPTLQKTPEGILLLTRLSSSMDLSFLTEGGHSLIRREVHLLREGDAFLDIGANIGYFSILASQRIGEAGCAIAIEPSLREYEMLLLNIRSNRATNIFALNCAASNKAGVARLGLEIEHTGLNKISNSGCSNTSQPVLAYPVEALIPAEIPEISLTKIDTEGYELFTLEGMRGLFRERRIKRVVIEISPDFLLEHGQSAEDIYAFFRGYGYSPVCSNATPGCRQWDEVFVRS
jgi:FkbM family methyltransferase